MKRNTIQKKLVLEAVTELRNHPTADEVYTKVSSWYPNISRSTVYRNLNQMAEEGSIANIRVPDAADRYDHITEKHYHVRCVKCGRVFDADIEYMPDFKIPVENADGFLYLGYELMFEGICPACRADKK